MLEKRTWIAVAAALAVGVAVYFLWPRGYCRSAERAYGIIAHECPDGELRQSVRIDGHRLRRGGTGTVSIAASALYTVDKSDEQYQSSIPELDIQLALVKPAGEPIAIQPEKGWRTSHDEYEAGVMLPDVPDGDYQLRATVRSRVGESGIDLPLALYAPARIHILTDRPLYEPGNQVKFRALVVRARDLTPIDHRPGVWIVRDPTGEVLLEEKAPAGEWGVVAGDFPLDREAASGAWTVTWQSGSDLGQASFQVEPFTLPRFQVELNADQPSYRAGDTPTLAGAVTYSSGAPVTDAQIEMRWHVVGRWPPPSEWMAGALPRTATTAANGRFEVVLPEVPADLQDQVTLVAQVAAIDPAGDRVTGRASVLLSQDAIQAQAITELGGELGGGLVENTNNRVYVRVTTADGRPLSGAAIKVKPAWLPGDEQAIDAETDADGVARFQIDPGPPVNVIIPALPARRSLGSSPGQLVRRLSADELVSNQGAPLADQAAMDQWLAPLEGCAKWVEEENQVAQVVLQIAPGGAVTTAAADSPSPLETCVVDVLRRRRLPAGWARLYALRFAYTSPTLPVLDPDVVGPLHTPAGLGELIASAAMDSRDCLPAEIEGELPGALSWQVRAGSPRVQASWLPGPEKKPMPPGLVQCIQSRVTRRALPEPAEKSGLGLVRYELSQPEDDEEIAPQPTVMKGYELLVSATVDGEPYGDTRLRMPPGSVPTLRLRAEPVLAEPGQDVVVTMLRGPDFTGDLPREAYLKHFGDSKKVKFDKESRTLTFKISPEGKGWYEVETLGYSARALIYVKPAGDLALTMTPAEARYAPGAEASLRIQTTSSGAGAGAGRGVPAAVGLFGVDNSLSQLVPLPGPGELGVLQSRVTMSEPAFGIIDGTALVLGRVRGRNAAEATILRVASVPEPPEIDVVISNSAETRFDAIAELTDRFYVALSELHVQARAWEKSAPEREFMTPKTMAGLWKQSLDALAGRGERVDDAFGRRLRLHRLPDDLLALTDPRQVIVDGTRLPEDVENWQQWVRRERP